MEDRVMEALLTARASIAGEGDGPVWNFDHWPSCTCGHIYAATAADSADPEEVVRTHDIMDPRDDLVYGDGGDPLVQWAVCSPELIGGLYDDVLTAVARSHGYKGETYLTPTSHVSRETVKRARENAGLDTPGSLSALSSLDVTPEELREAAIQLIDETIVVRRSKHEIAMRERAGVTA